MALVSLVDGEDSTSIANVSRTTGAVICYSDRAFKNDVEARAQFPLLDTMGRVISLAAATEPVDSANAGDGVDTEPGNLPPMAAATSIKARIVAGHWRPVGYADLSDMHNLISDLHYLGVPTPPPGPGRPWRVFTAHPTGVRHLCGPSTCGQFQVDADITQWWWSSLQNPGGPDLDRDVFRLDAFPGVMPVPPTPEDTMAIAAATNQDGSLEVFVELSTGEVKHIKQDATPLGWWQKADGSPNWLSLGTP